MVLAAAAPGADRPRRARHPGRDLDHRRRLARQARLGSLQRAAEARGERLDLASVIPPTVPDDQNFFAAPIVAEALKSDSKGITVTGWTLTSIAATRRIGRRTAAIGNKAADRFERMADLFPELQPDPRRPNQRLSHRRAAANTRRRYFAGVERLQSGARRAAPGQPAPLCADAAKLRKRF